MQRFGGLREDAYPREMLVSEKHRGRVVRGWSVCVMRRLVSRGKAWVMMSLSLCRRGNQQRVASALQLELHSSPSELMGSWQLARERRDGNKDSWCVPNVATPCPPEPQPPPRPHRFSFATRSIA